MSMADITLSIEFGPTFRSEAMTREHSGIRTLQINAEGFAKVTESKAEEAMLIQWELWSLIEEARKDWLKLAEREAQLAAELTTNLSACKTAPEIAKAYQDWMSERLVMLNQDSQRLFAKGQKFMASAVTTIGGGIPRMHQ
jgi:hypothetical protein